MTWQYFKLWQHPLRLTYFSIHFSLFHPAFNAINKTMTPGRQFQAHKILFWDLCYHSSVMDVSSLITVMLCCWVSHSQHFKESRNFFLDCLTPSIKAPRPFQMLEICGLTIQKTCILKTSYTNQFVYYIIKPLDSIASNGAISPVLSQHLNFKWDYNVFYIVIKGRYIFCNVPLCQNYQSVKWIKAPLIIHYQ
jgi:hypothetical protein